MIRLRAFAATGLLLLGACAAGAPPAAAPAPDAEREIAAMMEASAEAWNRGDLDGFLLPYREGGATTFVGGSGLVRGKDAVRELYRGGWWREGTPREALSFEEIEVRPLGADHALTTGRWRARNRDTGEEKTGIFSLVLARTSDGWRIVHDHSS